MRQIQRAKFCREISRRADESDTKKTLRVGFAIDKSHPKEQKNIRTRTKVLESFVFNKEQKRNKRIAAIEFDSRPVKWGVSKVVKRFQMSRKKCGIGKQRRCEA